MYFSAIWSYSLVNIIALFYKLLFLFLSPSRQSKQFQSISFFQVIPKFILLSQAAFWVMIQLHAWPFRIYGLNTSKTTDGPDLVVPISTHCHCVTQGFSAPSLPSFLWSLHTRICRLYLSSLRFLSLYIPQLLLPWIKISMIQKIKIKISPQKLQRGYPYPFLIDFKIFST